MPEVYEISIIRGRA